jgi:HEPN domain-containing protein
MRPEALQEAEAWLNRAIRDLQVSAGNLRGPEVYPDATAFFAQQAAEKALKAFLAAHEHPFPKTHDLERLVQWCGNIDEEFQSLLPAAIVLSPYVVEFRYPSGPLEPSMADAEEAVRLAGEVVRFVQARLFPEEAE